MNTPIEYPREAIALALAESAQLCAQNPFGNCAWYHASWPVLKGLGVFLSLKSDDDFLLPALRDAVTAGARRVLISGTADAGMGLEALAEDGDPSGLVGYLGGKNGVSVADAFAVPAQPSPCPG